MIILLTAEVNLAVQNMANSKRTSENPNEIVILQPISAEKRINSARQASGFQKEYQKPFTTVELKAL